MGRMNRRLRQWRWFAGLYLLSLVGFALATFAIRALLKLVI